MPFNSCGVTEKHIWKSLFLVKVADWIPWILHSSISASQEWLVTLTYPYILNSIPEWMLWFSQNRSSLQEEVFLKVPPNSQENTVPEPQACNFIKKETLALMFLCEFGEMFKNTFFIEHLRWLLLPISLKRPFFCWMSLCAGGTKIKIWILINQPSGYVEIEAYFVQFLRRVTSDVKFLHRFFFLIKVI